MNRADDLPEGNEAWASQSDRWPSDQLLREAGYQIHERRKDAEPVWRVGPQGRIVTQSQALAEVRRQSVLAAAG